MIYIIQSAGPPCGSSRMRGRCFAIPRPCTCPCNPTVSGPTLLSSSPWKCSSFGYSVTLESTRSPHLSVLPQLMGVAWESSKIDQIQICSQCPRGHPLYPQCGPYVIFCAFPKSHRPSKSKPQPRKPMSHWNCNLTNSSYTKSRTALLQTFQKLIKFHVKIWTGIRIPT